MLFLLTALALAGQSQDRSSAPIMSYEELVRCSGVTQAASELEGGESERGHALYDAALYWTLATLQAGSARGRPSQTVESDQTRARLAAVRQFHAARQSGSTAIHDNLRLCMARTPSLN